MPACLRLRTHWPTREHTPGRIRAVFSALSTLILGMGGMFAPGWLTRLIASTAQTPDRRGSSIAAIKHFKDEQAFAHLSF